MSPGLFLLNLSQTFSVDWGCPRRSRLSPDWCKWLRLGRWAMRVWKRACLCWAPRLVLPNCAELAHTWADDAADIDTPVSQRAWGCPSHLHPTHCLHYGVITPPKEDTKVQRGQSCLRPFCTCKSLSLDPGAPLGVSLQLSLCETAPPGPHPRTSRQ